VSIRVLAATRSVPCLYRTTDAPASFNKNWDRIARSRFLGSTFGIRETEKLPAPRQLHLYAFRAELLKLDKRSPGV